MSSHFEAGVWVGYRDPRPRARLFFRMGRRLSALRNLIAKVFAVVHVRQPQLEILLSSLLLIATSFPRVVLIARRHFDIRQRWTRALTLNCRKTCRESDWVRQPFCDWRSHGLSQGVVCQSVVREVALVKSPTREDFSKVSFQEEFIVTHCQMHHDCPVSSGSGRQSPTDQIEKINDNFYDKSLLQVRSSYI